MFDVINQSMLFLLNGLEGLTGSYGWAIIAVTVLIRLVLWPMNDAQTRSMKVMQELQPKMKQLQERYKDNPQKMQEAMMKFYAENKFNPFAGCLPLIVQIPILIGLYGAINSTEFLASAGQEHFLFIDRLYNTMQSHAGVPLDQQFQVKSDDTFSVEKNARILFKDGKTMDYVVQDPAKALTVRPKPLIPGEPVVFELPLQLLGMTTDFAQRIQSMTLTVVDQKTREVEHVAFQPNGLVLSQQVPTHLGESKLHLDVLFLVVIYGILTLLYQQTMQRFTPKSSTTDAAQAQMMKFMPLMFVVMLFFIPIPAGVMLYLVVTTGLMYVQTLLFHLRHSSEGTSSNPLKPGSVIDIKPDQA